MTLIYIGFDSYRISGHLRLIKIFIRFDEINAIKR